MLDNADPRLAAAWHVAATAAEVGAGPLDVSLLGRRWRLSRDAEGVIAHDEDGHSPAAIREAYGLIWLSPRPAPNALPELPEMVSPEFAVGVISRRTSVGAGVLIDNFLDVSHFSYLHQATFGRTTPVTTDGCIVRRDGWQLQLDHATDLHEGRGEAHLADEPISPTWRIATYSVLAPYVTHLQMLFPATDARSAATLICQPETSETTTVHVIVAWPAGDPVGLQEQLDLSSDVLDEDLAMLELMADPRLELSLHAELHTRADRASVAYRRLIGDYRAVEVTADATGR